MKNIYETLEMNIIQDKIMRFCASSLGKQEVQKLQIFDDEDDVNEALDKVDEAMTFIDRQGRLPLGGLSDISLSLKKANRDGQLTGEELLHVQTHLECVVNVQNYFDNSEITAHFLNELNTGLVAQPRLLEEIRKCITPDGQVDDHASPKLFHIRQQIRRTQSQIRTRMEHLVKESQDYLSIDQMTSRNNRLVLPVQSHHKNQIQGLIHAQSATGQTVYIEPAEVVSMNNQISLYEAQEKEEVERILFYLSQLVKNHYYHFHFNLEILTELDFIFAKAQFGVLYHCCRPTIQKDGNVLSFLEARHPCIDQEKVIANDIILKQHRILLITGSNTGGKTVTLKTAGLLSFMALCGLPVPAREAVIPLFDQIYVDLGDEQSIEQSLSTFSSHMMKIIDILHHATASSLVILDEIGSGTDPQEGESLAEAILSRFVDMKSFVLATTHYGRLKTFAKEHPEILMAAVAFDVESMKPTYHLKLDSVGQSYAIEIAELLGLDKNIVQNARNIKNESMSEHERLMETLQMKEDILEQKEKQLIESQEEVQILQNKYEKQLRQIENQKDQMIQKAKDEANAIIDKAKTEVQDMMNIMKQSTLKPHEMNQIRHDLDQMKYVNQEVVHKQDHQLHIGDHVRVLKMNREGDIVEILKNHMVMVSISGLNVKLHEDEVLYLHPQTKVKKVEKAKIKKSTVSKTGNYEINIIGKRYEEAMALVDKFLDDALVMGYPHVRIVHGMGTGALRKGVRKILDKNKHVVSYRDDGPNEGGLGATLVYFE